jgi:hypothetical protein
MIKGMDKPLKCDNNKYRCPLLDEYDNCKLQDWKDFETWEEQYAGCPLIQMLKVVTRCKNRLSKEM